MANTPDASNVDPRLVDSINTAAEDFPYEVKIISGKREGDPRFHGKGMALDVALYDPDTGKMVPNYQDPAAFRTYEEFAQKVRQVQQEQYPELTHSMRWGGYFSGAPGKYGAADLMHFDLGGSEHLGMAGGSWENGLTQEQAKLYPGVVSQGIDDTAKPSAKPTQSTYDKLTAAQVPANQVQQLVDAYHSGTMPADAKAEFEQHVKDGLIMLPQGASVGNVKESVSGAGGQVELPQSVVDAYNEAAANPYNQGVMPVDTRKELDMHLANGVVKLPVGAKLNQTYQGTLAGVKEAFTGAQRQTPATQDLPDYAGMPELNSASSASLKTALGTITGGPDEIAKVIKSNYPDTQIAQDEKGNFILKSSLNGQEYVIKPGFQPNDIARTGIVAGAFTPAGRATTIAGGALASGATELGLQGLHQAAGGSPINPAEVAQAAVLGGAVPAVVNTVQALKSPVKAALNSALSREAAPAAEAVQTAAPAVQDAAQTAKTVVPEAVQATTMPVAQVPTRMTAEELASTTGKATTGFIGSGNATQALAHEAALSPEALKAAEDLGIAQHLQPDHITTNQAFREVAQGVKSQIGSPARAAEVTGLQAIGERANNLINEIGGTNDLSQLSSDVKSNLNSTQQTLKQDANALYKQISEGIPAKALVDPSPLLKELRAQAEDLGGVQGLSSMEKMLLSKLSPKTVTPDVIQVAKPVLQDGQRMSAADYKAYMQSNTVQTSGATSNVTNPTYALVDRVRQDIGLGYKNKGPFATAGSGMLDKYYGILSNIQQEVANAHGMGELFTKAKNTVQLRKGIENDLSSLFGKHIDGNITTKLTTAINNAAKGNESNIVNMLKSVPDEMKQNVVASGLNVAFGKTTANGTLNFNTFSKWYEGLKKNQPAFNAIMTHLTPEARKQIANLALLSENIAKATAQRITTGRANSLVDLIEGNTDSLVSKIYGTAHKLGKGAAIEALTSSVGMHGMGLGPALHSVFTSGKTSAVKAADALLMSPEFMKAAKMAASGEAPKAARALSYSRPFIQFARAVGNPREMTNREKWIMQALEADNNAPTPTQK